MDLHIEYADEFPEALKAPAEQCLQDAIQYLESVPRPTALPEIEYLTPNWAEMKFCFAEGAWPHGLFSVRSMKGWAVCSYKSSGDLLINSEPVVEVVDVDPNICTTASLVYMLDQYFHKFKRPEEHLHRQLAWLDTLAPSNAKVKSLLELYEQQQAAAEAEAKHQRYLAQYPEKRRLKLAAQAEARRIKPVAWYDEKYGKPQQAPPPKPYYSPPPAFVAAPPLPPSEPAPTPTLSPEDARAMEILQGHQNYMRSQCMTTEDYDL